MITITTRNFHSYENKDSNDNNKVKFYGKDNRGSNNNNCNSNSNDNEEY